MQMVFLFLWVQELFDLFIAKISVIGRSIAVVYTPDDDLEHAYQLLYHSLGLNSGFPVRDVAFSPETQGMVATAIPYTPQNTIWAILILICFQAHLART